MTDEKESAYPRQADPDKLADDAAAEAQEYYNEVVRELARREERLAQVDAEIADLLFRLEQFTDRRILMVGDPAKISSAAGYKRHLRDQLKRKQQRRLEVVEEVERARERKKFAEAELEAENTG